MGDASDNIPGVPGIGEKTALKLVQQYGSLAAVLDRAPSEQKGKLRERLIEHRALAELSYDLATIDRNAPVAFDFDEMKLGDLGGGLTRLRELGMNAAARRLAEIAREIAPASMPRRRRARRCPRSKRRWMPASSPGAARRWRKERSGWRCTAARTSPLRPMRRACASRWAATC